MNKLYDEYLGERQEMEETMGESVALSFYYGNFSDGVKELLDLNITTIEFYEFMEEKADEYGCSLSDANYYHGHFTVFFFITLAEELMRARSK